MLYLKGVNLNETEKEEKVTYVLYFRGQPKIVTQREWEQSWLEWWKHKVPSRSSLPVLD